MAGVRYEYCYSPGTDFLLGRLGTLVSAQGHETESNYQVRYRETLIARGLWSALPTPPARGRETVVVTKAPRTGGEPSPGCFYRDRRFLACRLDRQERED